MYTCNLTEKNFENKPIWTSGCQSDPDDYECKTISEKTESCDLADVTDPIYKVYLDTILTNHMIERVEIQIFGSYSKWPDEYGSTSISKKITCEKKSADKCLKFNRMKVELNSYQYCPSDISSQCLPTDTSDTVELKKSISNIFFENTTKALGGGVGFGGEVELCITILERKA